MIAWWDIVAAMALSAAAPSPAVAQVGETSIVVISAPAPTAGASLPLLLLVGGYAVLRQYRKRSRAK